MAAYIKHAKTRYVKAGKDTSEYGLIISDLSHPRPLCGKTAARVWATESRGRAGGDPTPWTRTEVDASIRGVMLATEYLEEYDDWEADDDEETGGQQLELF